MFIRANIQPSRLAFGEDLLVNMNLFPHIKTFYAIDKVIYNYRTGLPGISDKYFNSWLENARKLYEIKMQVLRDAKYEDGIYYQKIELVNYIKSYINVCLRYRKNQRDKNIEVLRSELSCPVYKDLSTLRNTPYTDAPFAILIANGNADNLYHIMEQNVNSLQIKNKLANSIIGLLRHFS